MLKSLPNATVRAKARTLPEAANKPETDPLRAEAEQVWQIERLCFLMEQAMIAEQIRKANRTPAEVAAEEAHQERIAETVRRAFARPLAN